MIKGMAIIRSKETDPLFRSTESRKAGFLFCLGASLFLILTTASEALYPNFSMQSKAISDLAPIGTRSTIVEESAVLGLGICWSIGAYYLFRNTGKKSLIGFGSYLLSSNNWSGESQ